MRPKATGLITWRWACGVMAAVLPASPARAIVSTSASSNWTGTSMSALNGEAMLTISRANGSNVICSGSLLAGGQYVLTAGHCVTGAQATTTMASATVSLMNGSITGTASTYAVNPGWTG